MKRARWGYQKTKKVLLYLRKVSSEGPGDRMMKARRERRGGESGCSSEPPEFVTQRRSRLFLSACTDRTVAEASRLPRDELAYKNDPHEREPSLPQQDCSMFSQARRDSMQSADVTPWAYLGIDVAKEKVDGVL
jgi:hypothetical protein